MPHITHSHDLHLSPHQLNKWNSTFNARYDLTASLPTSSWAHSSTTEKLSLFNSAAMPDDEDVRTRFVAATALLENETEYDPFNPDDPHLNDQMLQDALQRFKDILRLDGRDKMGVRDIIPYLLLRLGREQECYDFLKWWATNDHENHSNGTLPCFETRQSNAFEPIDRFCSGNVSLGHLVALTLLKLRLMMDIHASTAYRRLDDPFNVCDYDSDIDDHRTIGILIQAKLRTRFDVLKTADNLEEQYRKLCRVVNDANPYFWDGLVANEPCPPPPFFSPSSEEEADVVLHYCRRAWQESEDAITMADADTTEFTPVYRGKTAVAGMSGAPSGGLKRGTGIVFPSKFEPPPSKSFPVELFPPTRTGRFVRRVSGKEPKEVLVYADGACPSNGQLTSRGGWAVVCGPPANDDKSDGCVVSGRLEDKGPFGDDSVPTNNRAELRAAIAALRLYDWRSEGYNGIVIATDSVYVVEGATGWVKGWVRKGWTTSTGGLVKNRDLWELLLGEVERCKTQGLDVRLWKIPRQLNARADAAAKQACNGVAKAEFEHVTLGSQQLTTAASGETGRKTRILVLTLDFPTESFGRLLRLINASSKMDRATTPEDALAMLDQRPPPSVILILDGAPTRQRKIWKRIIDHLREGATVVLAGFFGSWVNEGEFTRFFARLGLGWKRGSYYRAMVSLRRGVVDEHLTGKLITPYSQRALFVKGIEKSAAWYTEGETTEEAAVAFVKVGAGRLGYVGDVNEEDASTIVVLAMCGLLN